MKINSGTKKQLKIITVATVAYIPIVIVLDFLAPIVYGSAASQTRIYKLEAIAMMLPFTIGMCLGVRRVEIQPLWKSSLRAFLVIFIASCIYSIFFLVK